MSKVYSIRLPVHGFVEFDEWERDIINHPVFQRLRRIRQLALSEHVYPGAIHTRFEHSLGVMHVATKLFDALVVRKEDYLRSGLEYTEEGLKRARILVRLAALLHDVGHAPFSHSGEDLMPENKSGKKLAHEDYTAALIRDCMKDVIDNHTTNQRNHGITAAMVADFYMLRSTPLVTPHALWQDLVNGTLDADRMDYLLRDSYHCGVDYGRYDLARITDCVTLIEDDDENPRIAIDSSGRHSAEALILARYFMFIQVYFHKTRRAFDYHAQQLVHHMLESDDDLGGKFPDPSSLAGLERYLSLDDWAAFTFMSDNLNNRHAKALYHRKHDRMVYETPELAGPSEIQKHEDNLKKLIDAGIDAWADDESNSWYKVGSREILIAEKTTSGSIEKGRPLSELSAVVQKITPSTQRRIYVSFDQVDNAKKIVNNR